MGFRDWLVEKLNPAQPEIVADHGYDSETSVRTYTSSNAWQNFELVNRGVAMIVDACSEIETDVKDQIKGLRPVVSGVRAKTLPTRLNHQPNPFYDAVFLKQNVFLDLVIEGNAFLYWDGSHLFNLPAQEIKVVADKKTYIKQYEYGETVFKPSEIIHIRDNNYKNIFRGASRLSSSLNTIRRLDNMYQFQSNFFQKGTVLGLVLSTPNTLSDRIKDRLVKKWTQQYNPAVGGRKPIILDGDFKIERLGNTNFKELDFEESAENNLQKVLQGLGVPPILLAGGNNANITPNMKLFYLTTVLPLYGKYLAALENFFGYDLEPIKQRILALKPEMKDEANYYATLVNAGIMTRNEVRERLRLPEATDDFADDLTLPANVAGSNLDPSLGGKPPKPDDEEDNN
jgi:HK97 family phage portal protein